jgi:hypothetical protein
VTWHHVTPRDHVSHDMHWIHIRFASHEALNTNLYDPCLHQLLDRAARLRGRALCNPRRGHFPRGHFPYAGSTISYATQLSLCDSVLLLFASARQWTRVAAVVAQGPGTVVVAEGSPAAGAVAPGAHHVQSAGGHQARGGLQCTDTCQGGQSELAQATATASSAPALAGCYQRGHRAAAC